MRPRTLREVLARQWIAFGLLLFAGFAAMALLLLFVLEDAFIDGRLREEAARVATGPLPAAFVLHRADTAPPELRGRMRGAEPGVIREFRLGDGRYVHVLALRAPDDEEALLAFDVTDQLHVNAALRRAWPWLLGIGIVLALAAYALASAFVARVSRQAGDVLALVSGDPRRLRELADAAPIAEFGELARRQAHAWDARLAALQAERETLAFLGHELRTPLQSARTSLALLQADAGNASAWQRLQRAVDRLARASHGVLWLATADAPAMRDPSAVRPLVDALATELAPLAQARGQAIDVHGEARWPLPAEVAETVLANLLLNAIQHGGAGRIDVALDGEHVAVVNPLGEAPAHAGSGIGLQVVQRLLGRVGWVASRAEDGATVRVVVRAASG